MRCSELAMPGGMLVAMLVSCCGEPSAPEDGGADAHFDSGERDAGRPPDAGVDAEPTRDAGPVTWQVVEGVPEECPIRIAVDPESVMPALELEPCPGYASGCRQVIVDWEVEGPRFTVGEGYHDGLHGYFTYARGTIEGDYVLVVARDDGTPRAVLRIPPADIPCLPLPIVLGAGRFALGVARWESTGEAVIDHSVVTGSMTDPVGSIAVVAVLDRADVGNNSVQRMAVTETHVAIEVVLSHEVFLIDGSGEIVSSTLDLPRAAYLSAMHEQRTFIRHHGSPLEIRVSEPGGASTPFLPIDGSDVAHLATDGAYMAWLRLIDWDGASPDRVELWASPYALRAEDLEPRLLADDVTFGRPVTGGGHVAKSVVDAAGDLVGEVYEVASGERVGVVRPPAGTEIQGVWLPYLGPEELAFAPRPVATAGGDALTVQFIRYDALPTE